MKILFVSFGALSIGGVNTRSASILRALADAGHQVDVVAFQVTMTTHPHIRILPLNGPSWCSTFKIRMKVLQVVGRRSYDAIHAVDEAAPFAARICRFRKIRLIYDASRCFTGSVGIPPFSLWKFFPSHYTQFEKRMLHRAAAILTPCEILSADIRQRVPEAKVIQINNVPIQSMFASREIDKTTLLSRFNGGVSSVVVCRIVSDGAVEMKKLMKAARKVVEVIPDVAFFFKGGNAAEGKAVAGKLDILGRCFFLEEDEVETYLAALAIADAGLFIPQADSRYIHPEVFTILHSPAALVAIGNSVYDHILTDKNSVKVLMNSDSIAEGLLRVIQEPLFSLSTATEGQQLIADKYSLSSFKHKIRMTYHELFNPE